MRSVPFELSVESYLYNGMYPGAELPGAMRISRATGEKTHLVGVLEQPPETAPADEPSDASFSTRYAVDLGPADRSVLLEPVFEGRSEELSFTFTDPDIEPGINPYWVRVTQRDMHNA